MTLRRFVFVTAPVLAWASVLAPALASADALAEGPEVQWSAPPVFVRGQPFLAHVEIVAAEGGTVIASWLLTPAAFTVDGKACAKRAADEGALELPAGFRVSGDIDLGPHLEAEGDFKLGYASEVTDAEPLEVLLTEVAAPGLNFMELPAAELPDFRVIFKTNRGDMALEFYPDVAPKHVRNFLDLSSSGFYDGTLFHRVGPGFMIQGGDPNTKGANKATWGQGTGPRSLEAEFNEKLHERGVLSMARSTDPNSASCQFFVMHGRAPGLDRMYSVFGKLLGGYEALDAIASAPGEKIDGATVRPKEPQRLEKAIVCRRVRGAAK